MDRRSLLKALALTPVASAVFPAFAADAAKPAAAPVWNSERVNALFSQFGSTGKMPPSSGSGSLTPRLRRSTPMRRLTVSITWA